MRASGLARNVRKASGCVASRAGTLVGGQASDKTNSNSPLQKQGNLDSPSTALEIVDW